MDIGKVWSVQWLKYCDCNNQDEDIILIILVYHNEYGTVDFLMFLALRF